MIHETVQALTPMDTSGVFDLIDSLGAKTLATIRVVAGVICTAVFLWLSAKGSWQLPAILGSLMVTGLVFWGVYNITDIKDRVEHEINNSSSYIPGHDGPTLRGVHPATASSRPVPA